MIDFATDPYIEFLKAKMCLAKPAGFPCDPSEANPILFPHQRDIVAWAVRGGHRAIFAAYGLGKSLIQLETIRIILKKLGGGRGLIVCPLGVRQEFMRDAAMLGITPKFVRRSEEVDGDGIYLTNYESVRDGKLDPSLFVVVSLDEASVLRSYGSKTYQSFLTLFDTIPYRFVATATPAPNRKKELIHYAGFLGVMDTGQALTRFFQRNSEKANDLTLYPHKVREFYLWLHSWAVFLQRPSDLGYSDAGYDLPPLERVFHELPAARVFGSIETNGQATIMVDAAMSLPTAAREKSDSLDARIAKMREIIDAAGPEEHFVIWHTLESERHAIEAAIPEAVTVYGNQDMDERESAIIDFSEGRIRILATKPEIAGSGCNFQRHCHRAIYLGIDYKANDMMQSVHRLQRFQQPHPVRIDIIHTEAEREILKTTLRKWTEHNEMAEIMTAIIKEHGLNTLSTQETLARSMGVERIEVHGERYAVANNDAVFEARLEADNSVGEIVTSIPFVNHYEYTDKYEDMGHTDSNDHFWQQMDFLTPELFRILQPGRVACIHVKDRILFGNVTGNGFPTSDMFHCETAFHFRKHGFLPMGMITVETDVVRENNQTYRLSYSEMCKDGSKMGVGCEEYVLLFRKPQSDPSKGYADNPVVKQKSDYPLPKWQITAHGKWRSSGNRLLTAEEMAAYGPDKLAKIFPEWSAEHIYDFDFHVRIGEILAAQNKLPKTFTALKLGSHHPHVWHDVNRMLTLNGVQASKGKELHICPLQFDIVDRLIERYSNPGDVIYDPFAGLMTVPLRAMRLGRHGAGSELNPGYFRDGVHYLQAEEDKLRMPTLFDFEEIEQPSVRKAAA